MPEVIVPQWPADVPFPQTTSLVMSGAPGPEVKGTLSGPSRLYLAARPAPPSWQFMIALSREEFEAFETWYEFTLGPAGGEFYAPWIGGERVVAFTEAYQYSALGRGWALSGNVAQTRIDPNICNDMINTYFGALLIDDGVSPDIVLDDGVSTNIIADDYPLTLIAAHEC